MFIVISFPTKTTKNAENLGVSFWEVAKKKISGQKVPLSNYNYWEKPSRVLWWKSPFSNAMCLSAVRLHPRGVPVLMQSTALQIRPTTFNNCNRVIFWSVSMVTMWKLWIITPVKLCLVPVYAHFAVHLHDPRLQCSLNQAHLGWVFLRTKPECTLMQGPLVKPEKKAR